MDGFSAAAASGMRSRLDALDLISNNLANAGTAGYKADRELYNLYLSEEAAGGAALDPARVPFVAHRWTDFSQGLVKPSGNPFHVALEGDGFFVVETPGGPLYTRAGNFRLSPQGRLETVEGYPVATRSGRPLVLDPTVPVEITASGEVLQAGGTLDTLRVVKVGQPEAMRKRDGMYFQWASGPVRELPSTAAVHQGALESANATPVESAVNLVSVMREFEMLQRALVLGGEMNRRAIEEVARVS